MFRLVAVTLAALYGILYVFGDEDRRPEDVARAEPLGIDLVSVAAMPFDLSPEPMFVSDISDREAVEIALAAGEQMRADRKRQPAQPVQLAAVEAPSDTVTSEEPTPSYWYVTGSRVNLRRGPGTSNAVVGQVTFGMEAEVLADTDGWYQIRLADGSVSGWIFGKFLNEKLPG